MMIKTLMGLGIAATLAASLWSTIPPARQRVVQQITAVKSKYVEVLRWGNE